MTWKIENPQGNENLKIKYEIVPYTRGRGLDLGCGQQKTFGHFIGVDDGSHSRQFGWDIRPDVMLDVRDLYLFASKSLDFVFSSHLLEHLEKPRDALKEWWRVIKPGGYLVLYLPHKRFYPNIGQPGANPTHLHDFLPCEIVDMMEGVGGWDLVVNEERNEGMEYSFFQVYQKRKGAAQTMSYKRARPPKKAAVVRYGGFGDMIQASVCLPILKKEGYHVTMITTPAGENMLEENPYIDEFLIQDKDQVPNNELSAFWDTIAKRFDKFINLSESVEGSLLALPGRALHEYPKKLRHQICDVNYLERTLDIAGLAHDFDGARFFDSEQEQQWAAAEKQRLSKGNPLVMWSLSGSSVHKFTPFVDNVLAKVLLKYPETHFVLVGDEACKILECGWEQEPRVHCRSGVYSIRESLSLAKICDCVVGPETGVLNAVGMEPVPKVVGLSHSSHTNLSKHWQNAIALEPNPEAVSCYPCHKMHYGGGTCPRVLMSDEIEGGEVVEVTVPVCVAAITADHYFNALERILMWQRQKVMISV